MSGVADLVLNDPDVREELDALRLLVDETEGNVITFVLFHSVAEREAAVQYLKERLSIPVVECALSERRTDPLAVIEEVREPRACVQVYDLEAALPDATKYLNLRREAYARLPHAIVLWVGEHGLREVARHAPDFWAWRSGVFDARMAGSAMTQPVARQATLEDVRFTERGDLERRASLYEGLIREYELSDDADAGDIAHLRLKLAQTLHLLRLFDQAERHLSLVREYAEQVGDELLSSDAHHQLGMIAEEQREFEEARRWYEKSLEIKERLHDEHGAAITYGQLGVWAGVQGRYLESGRWLLKALLTFLAQRDEHAAQQQVQNFFWVVSRANEEGQAQLWRMWTEAGLPLPETEGDTPETDPSA